VKKFITFWFAILFVFANAQITPDVNGIIYVKPTATGTGDGSSWANATSSLRTAITTTGVSKVYAAVGYYHVQSSAGGDGIISLKNGVEVYGGFIPVNDETDWTTRFLPNKQTGNYGDWWNLEGSIIDGMTWNGGAGETIVINNSNLNNTAVLDGFSVIGGFGYSSGGGIINNNASPTLRNLVISSCSGMRGGAIYNNNSSPVVTNVIISANYANETISGTLGEGGGVHNRGNSSPVFTNTLFINNNAVVDYKGGAVYHTGTGTATFINCTFNNNTSGVNNPPSVMLPQSVTVDGGSVSFINSIVFGTVYGTYTSQNSMIQGNADNTNGNMNADSYSPNNIFINTTTGIVSSLGNYGLKNDAVVLNKGSNALFPGLDENSKDIRGNSRVLKYGNSGIIDMGAFENQYVPLVPTNGIVYVKPAATGEMDGSSWDNATSDLYSAVLATGVQKVFVSVGNHNLSDHSVIMKNGVEIYGGFDPDNGISDLTHNRILPNPNTNTAGTVLNGLNARPVIFNDNNGADNSALLDGFTLTNGKYGTGAGIYNNGASPTLKNLWIKGNKATSDGGGMFNLNSSSPVMTNITFENNTANYAGGVFNRNSSSPVMTNIFIKNNTANNDGGGMYNDVSASPVMTNVSITGNTAQNGAGMYNRNNCSPVLTNVLIANNTAATNGGAIRNENNSSPNLTNVTIANNAGSTALYATDGSTSLANSIVYGTISATYAPQYSLIEGNTDFTNGNIDAASYSLTDIFNDNANGDYSLKNGAVVVNEGNNALNTTETDLAGNPRIIGTNIDFGAYELFSLSPDANNIIYVNQNATGNGTGNSWNNAVLQLADAMKYARAQYIADNTVYDTNPLKIYVAKGTYKPMYGISSSTYTTDQTRDNAFVMVKNVQVYGGFDPDNGIDDLSDTRIFGTGGSILSGDIGITAPEGNHLYDNTYHLVVSSNAVGSALLDGFTITDAYSESSGVFITVNTYPVYRSFGAIYCVRSSPSFANCMITANSIYTGGGMYNYQQSSPTLTNCSFSSNGSKSDGGAIYNATNSSPVITNCSFSSNASVNNGGAIYNSTNSSPVITNCSFTENSAHTADGGAIYNSASSPIIINSLLANNSAGDDLSTGNGGAIYNTGASSPTLTNVTIANNTAHPNNTIYSTAGFVSIANSIIYGTISATYTQQYSLINGDYNETGSNYSLTDIFNDNANGDYTLKYGSAAINAGNNALNSTTTDLAGNQRIQFTTIDLGAYESPYNNQIVPDANGIVYVKPTVFGDGSGSSWSNATPNLQSAINGTNVQKVFVAVGNYPVGSSSFIMKNNVEIYGGFNPVDDNTDWNTRTLPNKGMGDGSVLDGRNERPLIWNDDNGLTNSAILDGFTLMNGTSELAGAMYNKSVAPIYNNLVIRNNEAAISGGGMYNLDAPIKMSNSVIKNNTALYGGGIRNNNSNAEFTNVSITNNTATMATEGAGGGGIFNELSDLVLTNVLIARNSTYFQGGGFRNLSGNPKFTNVTIAGNLASVNYREMEIIVGNLEINNSIVLGPNSGNYTAKYSMIVGNTDFSNGNIPAYALNDVFTNPPAGDFTLKNGSEAINKGSNALYLGLDENTKDLAGNPRVDDSVIDLGAYEYQGATLSVTSVLNDNLLVYPNPFTDILNISDIKNVANISVMDMSGRLVKTSIPSAELNLSSLNQGNYLLVIAMKDGNRKTVKVIKK